MKILFFPSATLPFHARTLDARPLGGIETAIIRLADALNELDHRVIVCTGIDNPPLSNPLYLPMNAIGDIGDVDVLIAVREWKPLFLPINAKVRMLWTGDSYDQPQNIGIGDLRVANKLDVLLSVSDWQGDRLCEESHFPQTKTHVLPNGVHMPYFQGSETRIPKRLIYSSTPYRGLEYLPKIFSKLREKHPEAELHVFSGYKVYQGASGIDAPRLAEYQLLVKVLESIPGVQVHGNVHQKQLAREFMKSSILAYPNSFEETSCITAMEAQAAGCGIVTSARGALPDTVGDSGVLIDGEPSSESYQAEFLDALDGLLSNKSQLDTLSEIAKKRALQFDWKKVASDFSEFLESQTVVASA